MKKIFLLTLSMVLWAGLAMASSSFGQQGGPPSGGPGGHGGPPPEFTEVCEGKSAGDTVSLTSPRGDTIEGICEDQDGTLTMRPTSAPPAPPDN